ncbi:MAG: amidohydrolase [bacterium]|nr:amidohydrolase [bacterium]
MNIRCSILDFGTCYRLLLLSLVGAILLSAPGLTQEAGGTADLVFKNGAVYTVNPKQEWATSVAVVDGKIAAVGSDGDVSAWIGTGTKVIDLDGKMLLPGFGDAHLHPYTQSAGLCDVSGGTVDETLSKFRKCAEDQKDQDWVQGAGWDQSLFEGGSPDKALLDKILPDRPALLIEQSGHDAWVNSRALEVAEIDKNTPDPARGRFSRDPKTGEPSGGVHEYATELIAKKTPPYTDENVLKGMKMFLDSARRVGITSATTIGIPWLRPVDLDVSDRQFLDAWIQLEKEGALTARINKVLTADLAAGVSASVPKMTATRDAYRQKLKDSDLIRAETVKIFGDGILEGYSAWLSEPYNDRPDQPSKGNQTQEELNEWFSALDKEGFQIHIHTIGDAAAHAALNAFEHTRGTNGRRDSRHTIAHNQLVTPADIGRYKELDVVVNFSPAWIQWTHYEEATEAPKLGDRKNWSYPVKSVADTGARLSFACDCTGLDVPGDRLTPLDSIEMAITHLPADPTYDPSAKPFLPKESVDLATAIEARTLGVAHVSFQDDTTGSIEVGKHADLVVLDKNLFKIPDSDIHNAQILATFLAGKSVYQDANWKP